MLKLCLVKKILLDVEITKQVGKYIKTEQCKHWIDHNIIHNIEK